eukprot:5940272-Amphidinium_carterae.1
MQPPTDEAAEAAVHVDPEQQTQAAVDTVQPPTDQAPEAAVDPEQQSEEAVHTEELAVLTGKQQS